MAATDLYGDVKERFKQFLSEFAVSGKTKGINTFITFSLYI